MGAKVMHKVHLTLRDPYPPGPPSTWQLQAGLPEELTPRQWMEAQRRGFVRIVQGHGTWEDVPLKLWCVDPAPLGD